MQPLWIGWTTAKAVIRLLVNGGVSLHGDRNVTGCIGGGHLERR